MKTTLNKFIAENKKMEATLFQKCIDEQVADILAGDDSDLELKIIYTSKECKGALNIPFNADTYEILSQLSNITIDESTHIRGFSGINETKDDEKDIWWKKNYKKLIEYTQDLDRKDWLSLLNNDSEMVDSMLDSTVKHRAFALLDMFNIEYLDMLISDDVETDSTDLDPSKIEKVCEYLLNLLKTKGNKAVYTDFYNKYTPNAIVSIMEMATYIV